jgi:hypothetical protein
MKIKKLHLNNLHNEEHSQFGADVIALVKAATPAALHVEAAFEAFTAVHRQENEVLERIRKSALTAKIDEADRARDEIFYGLRESVVAATRHFTPAMREAAGRLMIVFDTYGNVAARNYAEQTAAVQNLLEELTSPGRVADMETLGLEGWIQELDRRNVAMAGLLRSRDAEETAGGTDLVMKQVRASADAAYRLLVGQVEALGTVAAMQGAGSAVGPASVYEGFVASVNTLVERYAEALAVRRGRAAAAKAREEAEAGKK